MQQAMISLDASSGNPCLECSIIPIHSTETVGHRDTVEDLVRKGRDLEVVLARAVRRHIERRVLVYGRKTAVFD